jgi:alkanesulfonate monooxygenase
LEEAYRFAELVFPHLPERQTRAAPQHATESPMGEIVANSYVPANARN